jgi:hypothetical protein
MPLSRRVRKTEGAGRVLSESREDQPDFYAFWADGNPHEFSPSHLHFTNLEGDRVWRLPNDMTGDFAKPELVRPTGGKPTSD